jgi:hypothetical protein
VFDRSFPPQVLGVDRDAEATDIRKARTNQHREVGVSI